MIHKSENVRLVIFDMDGLLVDSEKVYQRAWTLAAERLGKSIPVEVINQLAGLGLYATTQVLIDYDFSQKVIDEMRNMREAYIHKQAQSQMIEAKAFAGEVLRSLREHGFLIAVASSSPRIRGTEILQSLNLYSFLDFSVFGDEVEQQKPSPEPYLTLLKMAKLSNKDVVIVEDSLTGITAARNADIAVLQVPDKSIRTAKKDETGYASLIGDDLRVVLDYLGIDKIAEP